MDQDKDVSTKISGKTFHATGSDKLTKIVDLPHINSSKG